ncbi:MAG: hypothetical protein ACI8TP_001777 [Acidimicrobiales bacterium]|jgi:hypothetical protein
MCGKPGDVAFQRDVLERALALTQRNDVPVLEDRPDVIDDQTEEAASCPMPPRDNSDLPAAVDEALGLRNAYDRNLTATGRTLLGRQADAAGVPKLIEKFIRIADGASLDDVGWAVPDLHGAGQDIRAHYEEADGARGGDPSAGQA